MKFYRYETIQYASKDHNGEYTTPAYPNPTLNLIEFELFKETSKGYWICIGNPISLRSPEKWIPKNSRSRYAYPTKEEALTNFIKRTEKRIKILEYQINSAKIGLNKAVHLQNN